MSGDLDRARALLADSDHSVVLVQGDQVVTADGRGVAPLVDWLTAGKDFTGYAAADRVVGRAAALLYLLLGVSAVHGETMSRPGQAILTRHAIPASAGQVVDAILNRDRSGSCPMEAAVANTDDPATAYQLLKATLDRLRANQS